MLAEALHLLRYGVRLDDVAARLGRDVGSLVGAVWQATTQPAPDGMTDLDLQALRRLIRADRARSRADANAEQADRAREWRWSG